MSEVGIRALKQNASAVVSRALSGETVTITDRGRPVAQLTPIPNERLGSLIGSGDARPAKVDLTSLPAPDTGPDLSGAVAAMRDSERF